MNKVEIFNEAMRRALVNGKDIYSELDGFVKEGEPLSLRTVMYEMIKYEVHAFIHDTCFSTEEEYEKWCEGTGCGRMYADLWRWIDNACPFGISNEDATTLFGFSTGDWFN